MIKLAKILSCGTNHNFMWRFLEDDRFFERICRSKNFLAVLEVRTRNFFLACKHGTIFTSYNEYISKKFLGTHIFNSISYPIKRREVHHWKTAERFKKSNWFFDNLNWTFLGKRVKYFYKHKLYVHLCIYRMTKWY